MKYVITTESPKDRKTIFLQDKAKTTYFWSSGLKNALVFPNKRTAWWRAKQFKHNNPKVITLTDALQIRRKQYNEQYNTSTDKKNSYQE